MSTFAIMSLFGIGDAYSQGNPHNLNLYVRPEDGKILAFPWDWDFVFSQAANAPLHGNKNIGKTYRFAGLRARLPGAIAPHDHDVVQPPRDGALDRQLWHAVGKQSAGFVE